MVEDDVNCRSQLAMSLNIKDEEVHRMARRLAELSGESMTAVIRKALEEHLARVERQRNDERSLADRVDEIVDRVARLPVLDTRGADEMLGYDDRGLPDPSGDFSLTDVRKA
jgi:antitoxin VapB